MSRFTLIAELSFFEQTTIDNSGFDLYVDFRVIFLCQQVGNIAKIIK